eukprot:scaffold243938_cov30-Tisochrysis_lutea.AAC.1
MRMYAEISLKAAIRGAHWTYDVVVTREARRAQLLQAMMPKARCAPFSTIHPDGRGPQDIKYYGGHPDSLRQSGRPHARRNLVEISHPSVEPIGLLTHRASSGSFF